MNPANLTPGQTYSYSPTDSVPILLRYWYEQLNYWSFTTVPEPTKIVLLHNQQIIKDLKEV